MSVLRYASSNLDAKDAKHGKMVIDTFPCQCRAQSHRCWVRKISESVYSVCSDMH